MIGGTLLHWFLYQTGFHTARTQTTPAERSMLQYFAKGRICIVELGVFEGGTSLLLREAMSPEGRLWLIDPFLPGRLGFSYGYSIARSEVERSQNSRVNFVRKLSYEAIKDWRDPIDMVFIDADHSYQAVRQDWSNWSPYVVQGGIIALHDSRHVPGRNKPDLGPIRLVRQIMREQHSFRIVEEVETLTVFERRVKP